MVVAVAMDVSLSLDLKRFGVLVLNFVWLLILIIVQGKRKSFMNFFIVPLLGLYYNT